MTYSKNTDFAAKDYLLVGNPSKIIRGTEIDDELVAIENEFDNGVVAKTGNTGSAKIPSGTQGQRDVSPVTGYTRFNTTTGAFEGYTGTEWGSLGSNNGPVVDVETYVATAGQTVFPLVNGFTVGRNQLEVYVDGINQYYGATYAYVETDYQTVTFVSGLHVGALVKFCIWRSDTMVDGDAANMSYSPAGGASVVTTVQAKLRESVSVLDFGAVGDGVADDTAAIQAAINSELTASGGSLYLPDGTYLISSALTIPFSTNWSITGASRGGTIIKQDADNTPIFYFTQDLTWGWSISDLSGKWTNLQPSTNTAAIMFSFYSVDNSKTWFNFRIKNIYCDRGFRTLSHAPSSGGPIWGFAFEDVVHNGSMSGGCVYVAPAVSVGQPNISIKNVYGRADSMVATEYFITIVGGDSISIDSIEVNKAILGSKLLHLGSLWARVGAIKTEEATYTSGEIIKISDSNLSIDNIVINGVTINTGTQVVAVKMEGAASQVVINNMTFTFLAPIVGKLYAFSSGSFPAFKTTIGNISGVLGTANAFLTNVGGTVSPNSTVVNSWKNIGTGIVGDTDLTLTAGLNEPVQIFKTNLTTSRSVTLADNASGLDSNLFTGFQWTIVNRQPSYSNSVVIKRSDGATLHTLSANGSVTLSWSRFAWTVISQST